MPKFKFFIDRKVTEWHRDNYEITAENQVIANIIMKEVLRENQEIENLILPDSTHIIKDTLADLTPDDYGNPTRELYSVDETGNDTLVEGNGDEKLKRR